MPFVSVPVALALPFLAVQSCWATQNGNVTPLLYRLGISPAVVPLVWLAGPVAGIIVQPIVGRMSDRAGKRKPFLVVGCAATVISALVLAASDWIGASSLGRLLAVCSFWSMDFSINALMIVLRSFNADVISAKEQKQANALFSTAIAGGSVFGYSMGAVTSNLFLLFGCVAVLLVSSVTLLVATVPEQLSPALEQMAAEERRSDDDDDDDNDEHGEVGLSPAAFPDALKGIWIVQMLAWLGWFSMLMLATELFEIRWGSTKGGNLAFATQAAVAGATATLIPIISRAYGDRSFWFGATVVQSVAMLWLSMTDDRGSATLAMGALGTPWAATLTVPWTIVSENATAHPRTRGVVLALFNLSQCIPEVACALIATVVLSLEHSHKRAALRSIFVSGALFAGLSAAFILIIHIPDYEDAGSRSGSTGAEEDKEEEGEEEDPLLKP